MEEELIELRRSMDSREYGQSNVWKYESTFEFELLIENDESKALIKKSGWKQTEICENVNKQIMDIVMNS